MFERFPNRECDFVHEVAALMPLQIICDMMGIPESRRADVFTWSNMILAGDDPEYVTSENPLQDYLTAGAGLSGLWLLSGNNSAVAGTVSSTRPPCTTSTRGARCNRRRHRSATLGSRARPCSCRSRLRSASTTTTLLPTITRHGPRFSSLAAPLWGFALGASEGPSLHFTSGRPHPAGS